MLFAEKIGRLRIVQNGAAAPTVVSGLPPVSRTGQGGLLDVAIHPAFAHNGWIYISYADPGPNQSSMTAVVRGRLAGGYWTDEQHVFRASTSHYRMSPIHYGSRFVFDEQGYLFVTIGDRGFSQDAQDLSRPNGKVHRIHDDGRSPVDNPFVASYGAIPTIWSCGHRNPQGLALNPATGDLWESEHGPRGGDELNVIRRGINYGWPLVSSGTHYDGTPIGSAARLNGTEAPVYSWTPSITVSAIAFYDGVRFQKWKGHLFVGSLLQQELRRLVVDQGAVLSEEVILRGAGRVRDVVSSQDGYLYLVLNNPDRIVRLSPVDVSQ
jgi:glucose/arabinose dehydrogenase